MLQSELFTKTTREAPKDEVSKNAQYLIRGGYIDKVMAGVFTILPLGLRILRKIENIIREEMVTIGGQEILMPALHPIDNYKTTRRDAIDVLFYTKTHNDKELVLGQSHEEIVVPLVKKHIESYRDLPLSVFQIQTKFRNELRAKSGIFRCREFIMKDLYSFHEDNEDFEKYYTRAKEAYRKILNRIGIGEKTYFTYASGGTFSQYSHEFQTLTEAGEDIIHLCKKCNIAVNNEIIEDLDNACPTCKYNNLEKKKAIEVANIFPLKSRFSDAFGLTYKDVKGNAQPIVMGCYGMGLTRLLGTIAELFADDKGIVWPEPISPFKAHIIVIGQGENGLDKDARALYEDLMKRNVEVLLDDRKHVTAGERFADADLIGSKYRIVLSTKTFADHVYEIKERSQENASKIKKDDVIKKLC